MSKPPLNKNLVRNYTKLRGEVKYLNNGTDDTYHADWYIDIGYVLFLEQMLLVKESLHEN